MIFTSHFQFKQALFFSGEEPTVKTDMWDFGVLFARAKHYLASNPSHSEDEKSLYRCLFPELEIGLLKREPRDRLSARRARGQLDIYQAEIAKKFQNLSGF